MIKELIQTRSHFDRLRSELDKLDTFALDVESNGKFGLFEISLVGISVGWDDYAAYIPLQHFSGTQLPFDLVLEELTPFLLDPSKEKIYHNGKFDEMVFSRYGIEIQGFLNDTMIMQHLDNELVFSLSLKFLIEEHFGYKMQTYEDIVENTPRKRGEKRDYNFAKVLIEDALSYAADDAYWTYKLYQKLKGSLLSQDLWDVYKYIEGPLIRVVRHMETRGITIDMNEIRKADEHFPKIVEELETLIFKEAGEVFNPGSGDQLGPILFEKLGIGTNPPLTPTGKYKTDKNALKIYQAKYPIVDHILRLKKVKTTHGTFVKGLEKFIEKDGRIHASFNSIGTDTGRFSSSKPNLQNQQGDEIEDIKIRAFFTAQDSYKLIVADYSQIELRLLAHFSKDQNMIDAFTSGRDFHDETSRKMLDLQGTPITLDEEVTPRQRFHAKSLNFGIPYGRQEGSVAAMLGIHKKCAYWPTWNKHQRYWEYVDPDTDEVVEQSREMCHNCGKCFIRDWYAAFPNVEPYKEHVIDLARKSGFVRTLSGRKRRLTDICSKDFARRTHAERQAFNTKIQGSAGDIIKLAMVALAPRLKEYDGHMLMTVHDELVMEVPEDKAEDCVPIIKETMENPFSGEYPLRLPMMVKPQICDRWSEGK